MSKETVLNTIKSFCKKEDVILEYDYKDHNSYHATIRTKMGTEEDIDTHSKWCDNWIKKFSAATSSNWIVRYTYPSAIKYIYRKVFKCQHNSFDKVKTRKRCDSRVRDQGCKAMVNILIKKINPDTIKNDHYLKENLNVVITINFVHNHNLTEAEAFSYLRMASDTQNSFLKYFDNGMTPSTARTYHKMLLEAQYEGNDVFLHLANAQINPTERQVNYLYSKWRSTNFGTCDTKNTLDILRQKEALLNEAGNKIVIRENPLIILILTPIMLRAHKCNFAHDIVFIDSSEVCDQTYVTFLFGAAKIGAVPLAYLLHTEQSEADYTLAFNFLRETLGTEGFGGYGFPNVIMTTDSSSERNSLKTVFPESSLVLCTCHMSQAFWRWLCDRHRAISKGHRKLIMVEFQRLLYSVCEEDAEAIYQRFLQNETHLLYDDLIDYIRNLWERRTDWIVCFRSQLFTRGNNTNSFIEAYIRISKDIVLQRCKAFDACTLLDFLVTVFESYHRRHLLTIANNVETHTIDIQLLLKCKDVLIHKIDDDTYRVSSSTDKNLFYTSYVDISFCDCISGQGGRFCEHLCAIQQKLGIVLQSTPCLTSDDRKDFAILALGNDTSTTFFNSVDTHDDLNENSDNEQKMQMINTLQNNDPFSEMSSPLKTENIIEEEEDQKHSFAVAEMSLEFRRIENIASSCISVDMTSTVLKLTKALKNVDTPTQLLHFFNSLPLKRGTRMDIQPTSNQEVELKRKRCENTSLEENINTNKTNGKPE